MDDALAWALRCFGGVEMGDPRLARRAVALAADLARRPGRTVLGASRSWAGAKGACRLLANPKASHGALLAPHVADVRAGCAGQRDFPPVEDTTILDFSGRAGASGFGPVGDGRGPGMMVHTTLGARVEGWEGCRPALSLLGVFALETWTRPAKPPGGGPAGTRAARMARPRGSAR